jgi:hypothetical protein
MVYLIHAEGTNRYKIGHTNGTLKQRLDGLQTGCPYPLRVLAAYDGGPHEEMRLHERYADYRVIGEWFELTSEALHNVLHTFIAQQPIFNRLSAHEREIKQRPYRLAHELWEQLYHAFTLIPDPRPDAPFRASRGQMSIHPDWLALAESLAVDGEIPRLSVSKIEELRAFFFDDSHEISNG